MERNATNSEATNQNSGERGSDIPNRKKRELPDQEITTTTTTPPITTAADDSVESEENPVNPNDKRRSRSRSRSMRRGRGRPPPPRPRGRVPGGYMPTPPGPGPLPNQGGGGKGEGQAPESEHGFRLPGGGSRPRGGEWTQNGTGGGGWTTGGGEGSGSFASNPSDFPELPFPFNQPEFPSVPQNPLNPGPNWDPANPGTDGSSGTGSPWAGPSYGRPEIAPNCFCTVLKVPINKVTKSALLLPNHLLCFLIFKEARAI